LLYTSHFIVYRTVSLYSQMNHPVYYYTV